MSRGCGFGLLPNAQFRLSQITRENMLKQMDAAAEMEARVYAKMLELEKQGIVKREFHDCWTILDQKRYDEAMLMPVNMVPGVQP